MPQISYSPEGFIWLQEITESSFEACSLKFSEITNTNASTVSFWNGNFPIDFLIYGTVFVDSKNKQSELLDIQSSLSNFNSSKINIVVSDMPLPYFFWSVLKRLIIPFEDHGSYHYPGDQFTRVHSAKYWKSDFASVGDEFRSGIGSIIGSTGIATYHDKKTGHLCDIPHLGDVILGNFVRLSNKVIISRGILGSTIVGDSTVIGTSTTIGHNVKIGSNCFIGPNVTICGSVVIHDNVFVGAGVIITNHCNIASDSYICAGSVVIKSYINAVKLFGNPARPITK